MSVTTHSIPDIPSPPVRHIHSPRYLNTDYPSDSLISHKTTPSYLFRSCVSFSSSLNPHILTCALCPMQDPAVLHDKQRCISAHCYFQHSTLKCDHVCVSSQVAELHYNELWNLKTTAAVNYLPPIYISHSSTYSCFIWWHGGAWILEDDPKYDWITIDIDHDIV